MANQRTATLRTVERLHAAGKIIGGYTTPGGHRRVRRPPAHVIETALRSLCDRRLHELKSVFFPHFDEVWELSLVLAEISNHDVMSIQHADPDARAVNIEKLKNDSPQKWKLLCCRDLVLDSEKIALMRQGLEPRIRLGTKAQILRLNNISVTQETLAAIQNISVPTLKKRFGSAMVNDVCRLSGYSELPGLFRYRENRRKIV
jgi:hypothetical protein